MKLWIGAFCLSLIPWWILFVVLTAVVAVNSGQKKMTTVQEVSVVVRGVFFAFLTATGVWGIFG